MASYSDVLRKRKQAESLRASSQRWREQGDSIGSFTTQNLGANAPMHVDYGAVLNKGLSAYKAASAERDADKADAEADDLNNMFMQETLGSDEQAMKLYRMAEMGVPGADKALAEHINPRKEAMGAFLQYFQSGMADPAMAAEIAPRFGISSEMASRAAEYAARRYTEEGDLKHMRNLELQDMRNQGRRQPTSGMTATGDIALTPGEKQQRAKMMQAADGELMELGQSTSKYEDLVSTIQRDQIFGASGKVAQFLADSPSRTMSAIGRTQLSEGSLMLKEYMNSKVLARMKMLGGSDSNEELRTITASLPDAMNDKQAAMSMLEKLHNWEETVRLAVKMRRDDIQSGTWFGRTPSREEYYMRAKKAMAGGGEYSPPETQGPAGIPTEQIDVEGMLDELGIQ